MIGSAVDNISKLRDWDVPQQAILAFASSLWRAFEEMVQVAEGWTKAAYEHGLCRRAGKAIAMIGAAVDNISKFADFNGPSRRSWPCQLALAGLRGDGPGRRRLDQGRLRAGDRVCGRGRARPSG